MKEYYVQYNVGSSKYCVSYHDGIKTHNDGNAFYDIHLTNNKKKLDTFIKGLIKQGYTYK